MTSAHVQSSCRASWPSIAASIGPPTDGGGLRAMSHDPTVRIVGARTTAWYAARSAWVTSPPLAAMSVDEHPTDGAGGEERDALCRKQVQDVGEIDVQGRLARLERAAVGSGHQCVRLGVVTEEGVADDGEVEGRGCADRVALAAGPGGGLDEASPRHQSETVPRHPKVPARHRSSRPRRVQRRSSRRRRRSVGTWRTPWPNADASRPRPGISTLPSMTTGSQPASQTLTKAPPHEADDPGLGAHGGEGRRRSPRRRRSRPRRRPRVRPAGPPDPGRRARPGS